MKTRLFLVALFFSGVLAACGGGDGGAKSTAVPGGATQPTQGVISETPLVVPPQPTGYPVPTEAPLPTAYPTP